MNTQRRIQAVNSIILIVALVAIAAGLAALTLLTARAAGQVKEPPEMQTALARLAWVAMLLLSFTLVLLLWAVMRFVRSRIRFSDERKPTPYVDAWALAGKRFRLPEVDDEGDEKDSEDDDEDEDDDEGRADLR